MLVLEEDDRVLAADRGAEEAVASSARGRADHPEPRDGGEQGCAGLRMVDRTPFQVPPYVTRTTTGELKKLFERHRMSASSLRSCMNAGQM